VRNAVIMLISAAVLVLPAVSAQDMNPLNVLNSDASHEQKAEACRVLALQGEREAMPELPP